MWSTIKRFFTKLSQGVKDALKRWESIFKSETSLFIAEIMASAAPLIDELKTNTALTGTEKRDLVASRLVSVFAKHAMVAGGRILASEVKQLVNLGIETQLTSVRGMATD